MSDKTYVSVLPDCDIHKYEKGQAGVPATVDGKTTRGPWANMCDDCHRVYGVGLGTGKGQRLIVGEPPERDRQAEVNAALEAGDFDALEDAIGDGDPFDYL